MALISDLSELATQARHFLQPHWQTWHAERGLIPAVSSQWTCSRSSLFLQKVFDANGIDAEWATGCPQDDRGQQLYAGFRLNNSWIGHSWVETSGFIVDITADQFGLAPVSILPADDERYCKSEDYAYPDAKQRRQETVAVLWRLWLSIGG